MRTTKAQISLCVRAVWSAALLFADRQYNASSFYIRNFKPLSSFCGCAGRFESTLVANPVTRLMSKRNNENTTRECHNQRPQPSPGTKMKSSKPWNHKTLTSTATNSSPHPLSRIKVMTEPDRTKLTQKRCYKTIRCKKTLCGLSTQTQQKSIKIRTT